MKEDMKIDHSWYRRLSEKAIDGTALSQPECEAILTSSEIKLISLIDSAFQVRKKYAGMEVLLHIIDNVQNGMCPEDCRYCAQSSLSKAQIQQYPMKSDDEILSEAKDAYEAGAWRHCMVFSGRSTTKNKIERISNIVKQIKSRYKMQACVSPGIVDKESLKILKEAGVDRINHNLNTSEKFYSNICTSHSYADRLNTLAAAREAGLEICCGVIVGMGETQKDVIEVARRLNSLKIESIPVNFYIPIKGTPLSNANYLTPQYCLRVLCLFRLLNPKAEIRIAAGREYHLRDMEVLSIYAANSLFIDGYLNTKGSSREKTLRMIKDAGFTIKSDKKIGELLKYGQENRNIKLDNEEANVIMKKFDDLHPSMKT